jgi:hypothetical protein
MEPKDELKNLLIRRMLEGRQAPPKCVLFVDMLGFSKLTEQHPNPVYYEFGDDDDIIASGTDGTHKPSAGKTLFTMEIDDV